MLCLYTLMGCQSTGDTNDKINSNYQHKILGSTVAASFAPDGRLWRLVPTKNAVYVDYSDDNGNSFQQPVKINPVPQNINVWPENPPAIAISQSGQIYLIYYADAEQKATIFFSFSDDNGNTFSKPVVISNHAATDRNYMGKILVTVDNKVYLFWHDTRDIHLNEKFGASVLSLFFSTKEFPKDKKFINRKVSDGICSCCRTSIDLSAEGLPVIMARMIFNGGIRDHALIKMEKNNVWSKPLRITQDQWQIEACPEHGPALSIDDKGRSHFVWFTLGSNKKGIFYAHTDDFGKNVSPPRQLGEKKNLPSHPVVKAVGQKVVLAWKEFDGTQASIVVKESSDSGETWRNDKKLMVAGGESGYPDLVVKGNKIFLSWTSRNKGHQFIEVN